MTLPIAYFAGEMRMETTFDPIENETRVTITLRNIPPGIKPEDNEKGTRQSWRS
ncbi:MAG: hypothetical protein M3Z92_09190 [Bacteroidota bacterium]|nr:hypothetical protein [Bacteroidota bacterium]